MATRFPASPLPRLTPPPSPRIPRTPAPSRTQQQRSSKSYTKTISRSAARVPVQSNTQQNPQRPNSSFSLLQAPAAPSPLAPPRPPCVRATPYTSSLPPHASFSTSSSYLVRHATKPPALGFTVCSFFFFLYSWLFLFSVPPLPPPPPLPLLPLPAPSCFVFVCAVTLASLLKVQTCSASACLCAFFCVIRCFSFGFLVLPGCPAFFSLLLFTVFSSLAASLLSPRFSPSSFACRALDSPSGTEAALGGNRRAWKSLLSSSLALFFFPAPFHICTCIIDTLRLLCTSVNSDVLPARLSIVPGCPGIVVAVNTASELGAQFVLFLLVLPLLRSLLFGGTSATCLAPDPQCACVSASAHFPFALGWAACLFFEAQQRLLPRHCAPPPRVLTTAPPPASLCPFSTQHGVAAG